MSEAGDALDAWGCWRAGPWAATHLEARGLGSEAQEELRVLRRSYEMVLDCLKEVDLAAWQRMFPEGVMVNGVETIPPSDEVARARAARELPRLTDTSGPTGVVVEVVLAPQPRAPRKRP